MNAVRASLLLAAKDLRIERRGWPTLSLVVTLGLAVVVVLAVGFGDGAGAGPAATLWIAYLLGGAMCFERTMGVERRDEVLSALLMAPVNRGALYAGKLLANLVLMVGAAAAITPPAVVLFRFDLSAAPLRFAAISGLGLLGFAAVGTLFSAATSSSRLQGGFLTVLVFPLSLPAVLASSRLLAATADPARGGPAPGALALLVVFDLVFLAAGWLAFEVLLEP